MQLAYLAGLIDGEGCIGFTRTRQHWHPRIIIANTSLELLQAIQCQFGGDIKASRTHQTHAGWKPSYNWRLGNSRCVLLLDRLAKYLRLKEPQARLTFLWDAIRPGRGRLWNQESLEALELIIAQSRWLNLRGLNEEPEPMAIAYSVAGKSKGGRKK